MLVGEWGGWGFHIDLYHSFVELLCVTSLSEQKWWLGYMGDGRPPVYDVVRLHTHSKLAGQARRLWLELRVEADNEGAEGVRELHISVRERANSCLEGGYRRVAVPQPVCDTGGLPQPPYDEGLTLVHAFLICLAPNRKQSRPSTQEERQATESSCKRHTMCETLAQLEG